MAAFWKLRWSGRPGAAVLGFRPFNHTIQSSRQLVFCLAVPASWSSCVYFVLAHLRSSRDPKYTSCNPVHTFFFVFEHCRSTDVVFVTSILPSLHHVFEYYQGSSINSCCTVLYVVKYRKVAGFSIKTQWFNDGFVISPGLRTKRSILRAATTRAHTYRSEYSCKTSTRPVNDSEAAVSTDILHRRKTGRHRQRSHGNKNLKRNRGEVAKSDMK